MGLEYLRYEGIFRTLLGFCSLFSGKIDLFYSRLEHSTSPKALKLQFSKISDAGNVEVPNFSPSTPLVRLENCWNVWTKWLCIFVFSGFFEIFWTVTFCDIKNIFWEFPETSFGDLRDICGKAQCYICQINTSTVCNDIFTSIICVITEREIFNHN